jgi:nucleoside-diphosphate-sugar epimerase
MTETGRVVWVSGASSQLGVFLLPRLRAAGFRVLALSRKAPSAPLPQALEVADGVRWAHPEDAALPALAAADGGPGCLVSCGPLPLARRIVESAPGLRRVVAFSSSSVLSKADSADSAERASMAAMARDEAALAAACAARGLPMLLLRPTLIYGCGLDRNVSLLAACARRFGAIPLAGKAAGLRQPVHADDLAALALRALTAPAPVSLDSPACGGSTLTYREMARRVAAAAPRRAWGRTRGQAWRRARLLTLPEWLLAGAVTALARFPRWRHLNAEMARRQSRDLVFDDTPLRNSLDWSPRPFEPTPADFEIPARAQTLQLCDPHS